MIITSTKKKKPNLIDNFQKIIDSAGETQFKNIYRNLQTEIKDKIITQLLSKLENQKKLIEEYKQEIIALKNDLVYLLKRIIISKNEDKSIIPNINKKKNYKLVKNNSLSNNIKGKRSFSPTNNKSPQLKSVSNYYNQTESKNNNDNINIEMSNFCPNQNELDIKIINYINSIYKHNFAKNETNVCDYYSLNKNESLYDEIFHKKINKKNNEFYVGTDPCLKKKKTLYNNQSQRNISTSLTKRPIETVDERRKSKKLSSSMVNIKKKNNYSNTDEFEENVDDDDDIECRNRQMNIIIKDKKYDTKYLKVTKKKHELSLDQNNLNNIKNYKSFKKKTQQNGFYSATNGNKINYNSTGLKKKIKRNYQHIPLNRSPFIANKF